VLSRLFTRKPPPPGRRGVFQVSASFGRSLMFGHGPVEAQIQVEVVELERRGPLSKVWYDKRTMTGLPPSAYPSTICSMLPAWQRTENVVWLDEPDEVESDATDSADLADVSAPGARSRPSPLAS
jgi:hypothetical protein